MTGRHDEDRCGTRYWRNRQSRARAIAWFRTDDAARLAVWSWYTLPVLLVPVGSNRCGVARQHRGSLRVRTAWSVVTIPEVDARRALILHARPVVVGRVTLTLSHGAFVIRAASNLAEAEAILAAWRPNMSVIDMDHDDSTALLKRLGASNDFERSGTPVLGLTRRGDLKAKLRAFDLGVDDILAVPFSPEELLARAMVIARSPSGVDR